MKKASNTTKTIKSLGKLSLFPREIRDEIYRHSLSRKKYSWWSILDCTTLLNSKDPNSYGSFSYVHRNFMGREWTESNLSILCLSKAIKKEAMASLYLNGTLAFQNDNEIKVLQHPSTDNMTNIEIFCGP